MRLGIRTKQIGGVTAIVGIAVVALSALYVTRLSRVVLQESQSRGELLANAIYNRSREVVTTAGDPYAALGADPGLLSILKSSLYGANVTDAAIVDKRGVVVAHSDLSQLGSTPPARADLAPLVDAPPLEKLRVIYSREGQNLEIRRQMTLGDEAFGSIRIGLSTLLMKKELTESLRPTLYTAAGSLVIAVFVAALLAQLLLRPIHVIRSGLTRLGKGEFGVTLDLPPGDEFGELGTYFNNISQQLSADRTLLAGQKANLQSAVEHLEDAVALFNPSGELLFSNPAMQPLLPADAMGRALQGLLPTGHPYRTLVEETLATRRSRGPVQVNLPGVVSRDSGIVARPSGIVARDSVLGIRESGIRELKAVEGGDSESRIPDPESELLVMTHAIAGTDGELVGVLLVARNLAYLSQMQSTIAYSRKLVALGRLTAGIAHEVKNPLNAMMIHLELLRTKIRNAGMAAAPQAIAAAGGTGDTRRGRADAAGPLVVATSARAGLPQPIQGALEHVEVIETEIRRLDEVVQGFLKFTRPEDLRLQPVTVVTLFEELLPLIAPEAQQNNVRVTIDCHASVPSVNADAAMMRQVFLNLANNACQAMPNGGTLRLTCGPASKRRVEVKFVDSGVGIPPENLGKIFDLYFTTKDHGTGLGLSMVYRIVQLHDGDVEVQSTPGHGTTFRILLPRANER
jgi:signal transduction histidine kinase